MATKQEREMSDAALRSARLARERLIAEQKDVALLQEALYLTEAARTEAVKRYREALDALTAELQRGNILAHALRTLVADVNAHELHSLVLDSLVAAEEAIARNDTPRGK
jgi:hypothetical protein